MSPRSSKFKLPSSKEFEAALTKDGFTQRKNSGGSHSCFFKKRPGLLTRVVVLPLGKKEIPIGTVHSMLRQAGWTKEYFQSLR